MPPLGQAPQVLAPCLGTHWDVQAAHLPASSAGKSGPFPCLLELATRVQRYLADIWPLGFPDNDSCTHPGTAEPVVLRRDMTKGPTFPSLCKLSFAPEPLSDQTSKGLDYVHPLKTAPSSKAAMSQQGDQSRVHGGI